MIFKELIIENYLCYYGIKKFEFSNGLNIILGENGEGKTKFYEALDWLLNESNLSLETLVSAKAMSETEIHSAVKVRVSITVEQYGEIKILQRSFLAYKISEDQCSISNFILEGIEENKSGERSQVDGRTLLDQVFPNQIRRYSLFKGESELNIFKNEDALINLINLFSEAKHYDKYSEKGAFLKEKAEKAVEDATRSDNKNQAQYKKLESEISTFQEQKKGIQILLDKCREQTLITEENIEEVENHVKNAEALNVINDRIKEIEKKIVEIQNSIDENYTTSLFDESWILTDFESIHREFVEKISKFSSEKRTLQSQFDREIGIKEGVKKAKAEILNNSIPLPIGVPSRAHMEEMLRDEICKVCNRSAPHGSESHDFMIKRLEEYLLSQTPDNEKTEVDILFKNDHVLRLFNLSASHEDSLAELREIKSNIETHFEFNEKRKTDLKEAELALEAEISEREEIIGSSNAGAEKLTNIFKNYNAWQKDLKNYYKEVVNYEEQIKNINKELKIRIDEKESIDLKTANNFLLNTRSILRDIEFIFSETKQKKFDEFISLLQEKSNDYFSKMNKGAFTGEIFFNKHSKQNKTVVSIELQEDGRHLHKPNQSLQTSMHISILFGISQLTKEKREEAYPLVFDAPTSSFGETKTGEFLNIISETDNQIILLSKDFLSKDSITNTLSIKPEFTHVKRSKAFWVRLQRPFDEKVLKTINTEIITL